MISRTLVGLLYISFSFASMLLSAAAFSIFYACILGLLLHEFYGNFIPKSKSSYRFIALCVSLSFYCLLAYQYLYELDNFPLIPVCIALTLLWVFVHIFYVHKDFFAQLSTYFFSLIYLVFPLILFQHLAWINGEYQADILIVVLITVCLSDTYSFIIGKCLGRHFLFKRISPKKTLEGFIGGYILSLVSVYGFIEWFSFFIPFPFIFITIIFIFASMGDLFASALKREKGMKDFGTVLKKHGGWLDRLDSLLFAIPATYIYILIIPQ